MPRLLPVLTILLTLAACEKKDSASDPETAAAETPRVSETRATRVEVAVVRPTQASIQTRWPGEVVGSRDALLASSMGGFIERVLVEEGDDVTQNQVLVRVDTASAGARSNQARVEVEAAEREVQRAEQLGGAISDQQVDAARTRLAAARAALRTANVMSSRAVIRAPFAGTIATVNAERGEVAAPGAPLVRLIQLSPVQVSIAVPDRDISVLRPGMPVNVRVDATAAPVSGEVKRVSPAADLRTRAFDVRVELANEDRALLPGMIAEVQIAGGVTEDAIVIPQYALVTAIDENGVFIENNGQATWQPVQTGRVIRDQVVIESGLSAGQRLIVTGHRELAEGDNVLVVREGYCCTDSRVVFDDADVVAAAPAAADDETDESAP